MKSWISGRMLDKPAILLATTYNGCAAAPIPVGFAISPHPFCRFGSSNRAIASCLPPPWFSLACRCARCSLPRRGLDGGHGGLGRHDAGLSGGGGAYSTAGSGEDCDAVTEGGRLAKSKPRLEGLKLDGLNLNTGLWSLVHHTLQSAELSDQTVVEGSEP